MTLVPVSQDMKPLVGAFLVGFSGNTRQAYKADLDTFWAFCGGLGIHPLEEATRAVCDAYVRWMTEVRRYRPATVARKLSTIRGFFEYAVSEELLDKNPCAHVKGPKVSNESRTLGLTKDELMTLLNDGTAVDEVAVALIALMGLAGLRVSEALSLTWQDFGMEQGRSVVKVVRKGGQEKTVAISNLVWQCCDALWYGNDAVFSGISRSAARRRVQALVAEVLPCRAGEITPHSLRHTFVTLCLAAGVPLHEVQDAAGHANPATTMRYARARHRLTNAPADRLSEYLCQGA